MKLRFIVFICVVLVVASCDTFHQSPSTATKNKAIIVDTDMGSDDWLALLYLFKHPKADLVGITLSGAGLSELSYGVKHLVKLQELTEVLPNKSVPIALGSENALKQTNPYPESLRVETNDFYGIDSNISHSANVTKLSATDFLIGEAHKNKDIEILALGPLTNLAMAINKDKSFVKNVKRLVIMGGAVNVLGNVHYLGHAENTSAEFNIFSDPEAAAIVFASGIPIELVALDVTNEVPVTIKTLDHMARIATSKPLKFMVELLERSRKTLIEPGYFYAWDPLAATVLMEEELYDKREALLAVDTNSGSTYGKTYQDAKGAKVHMITPVKGDALEETWKKKFLEVFN